MVKDTSRHYVNGNEFREALVAFKSFDGSLKDFERTIKVKNMSRWSSPLTGPPERLPKFSYIDRGGNFIGDCVVKLCQGVSMSKNFIGYSYREEMVEDAIENCLMRLGNYDPNISKYAFAYFSRIAFFACVRRIKMEQKQQRIKYKMLSDSVELNAMIEKNNDSPGHDVDLQGFVNSINSMMAENEVMIEIKETAPKPKKEVTDGPLSAFI